MCSDLSASSVSLYSIHLHLQHFLLRSRVNHQYCLCQCAHAHECCNLKMWVSGHLSADRVFAPHRINLVYIKGLLSNVCTKRGWSYCVDAEWNSTKQSKCSGHSVISSWKLLFYHCWLNLSLAMFSSNNCPIHRTYNTMYHKEGIVLMRNQSYALLLNVFCVPNVQVRALNSTTDKA